MDRRAYLRRLSAAVPVALAGCTGGDDEETPTETATATDTASPTATTGGTPTATEPTPKPTPTSSPTPTRTPTPSPTPRPAVAAEVEVGPEGRLRFEPETVEVATGETVRWLFRVRGHNVKPTSTPSGSDWSGTPGDDADTLEAGSVYTHTFEVAGTYEYVCYIHRNSDMEGTVVVE